MSKSKRSGSDDRLTQLPDSLIFHIYWFLPIKDVVRTTILTKRWRNLWTKTPFLYFSDFDLNNYRVIGNQDKVRNFCNRALLLWRGPELQKFKVTFRRQLSISLAGDIDVWVRFAAEKQVRELYLDLDYPCAGDDDNDLEAEFESLWSCSSLEALSIKGCPFSIGSGNVKWDRLKSLTIYTDHFREDMFTKVLCGSPLLEVFILNHVEREGNCCIQSTSLKKLAIVKLVEAVEYERNTEMKIETPNLEILEISGAPYSKFSMDVAPLSDVTLELYCMEQCCDYGEGETPEFVHIKESLEQILPTIQHVESLTLSVCCLEVLGVMNKKSLLSPLCKVKLLKFNASSHLGSFSKHLEIAGLLQFFPKLKRLVIEDDYKDEILTEDEYEDDYGDDLEFEASLPISFLLQLRTVEVTWAGSDKSIFSFIKTLLKYASKLEKMVFQVTGFMPPSDPSPSMLLASQKLLRMPRSSTMSQIFCIY